MKPAMITIDKQSAIDAALMLIGSAIGASVSVAVFVYAFMKKQHHGQPPASGPGERPLK